LVTPEAFQGRKFQKVFISAVTGFGLNNLRDALFQMTGISDSPLESGPVAINRRHADSLTRASNSLDEAIRSVQKGMTNEFVAVDVRAALGSISEITGETTTEDVLNGIFERFCVGK
jgi:tRNA modification GTPase